MNNRIPVENWCRTVAVVVSMTIFAGVADGQQGDRISKAQVQAVLDSIDKACLNKDAAAVIANYASNAVITATVVQNGQTYTNRQNREDYRRALENSLKNAADYSLRHRDVAIQIAPDGQTAQCSFTLIERWRGDIGKMEEGDTKESLGLVRVDDKLLIARDHSDVTVVTQTGNSINK
ncbi:MAG TPA: hypothetical protein VMB80_04410 [Candidatus Acidoferrum sp.]|nr:hypothetical protein [Candidatus Acidoferrum sp.]